MNTQKSFFINGFYYALGFQDNPIRTLMNERAQKFDIDDIKSDWAKIGNDIKKIYESQTANIY
jgi:hypothetical protein